MKKFIRWLWWNYVADLDEKYDILRGKVMRDHKQDARQNSYLGHSNECCEPKY